MQDKLLHSYGSPLIKGVQTKARLMDMRLVSHLELYLARQSEQNLDWHSVQTTATHLVRLKGICLVRHLAQQSEQNLDCHSVQTTAQEKGKRLVWHLELHLT